LLDLVLRNAKQPPVLRATSQSDKLLGSLRVSKIPKLLSVRNSKIASDFLPFPSMLENDIVLWTPSLHKGLLVVLR
jgi:hypothetical protein